MVTLVHSWMIVYERRWVEQVFSCYQIQSLGHLCYIKIWSNSPICDGSERRMNTIGDFLLVRCLILWKLPMIGLSKFTKKWITQHMIFISLKYSLILELSDGIWCLVTCALHNNDNGRWSVLRLKISVPKSSITRVLP